jgi:hypothetical protein
MKSRPIKSRNKKLSLPEEDVRLDEELLPEGVEPSSISDFIKIKKLQNQILEKLIENITNQESSKKIKNRKNK